MTEGSIRCIALNMRLVATPDRGTLVNETLGIQPHTISDDEPGRGRRHVSAQGLDVEPRAEVDNTQEPPVFSPELTPYVYCKVLSTYFALF
jgi:hypothetical protein